MLKLSSSLASEIAPQSPDQRGLSMSSRLWLAVAFVLASGASPARAETSAIAVTLDQAKIASCRGHGDAHRRQSDDRRRNDAQKQQYDGHHRQGLRPDEPHRDRRRGIVIEEKQIRVLPSKSAGRAARKLQDFLLLQSHLHADRSTRRRRQGVQRGRQQIRPATVTPRAARESPRNKTSCGVQTSACRV